MLNVSEALQQAEFTTNAAGQSLAKPPGTGIVQLNLSAWETIQAAMQPQDDDTEDEALMMQLFLDFITADALKNNTLQPYTIAQSEAAHSLIHGIELDYD
jgi:hypothetical protein